MRRKNARPSNADHQDQGGSHFMVATAFESATPPDDGADTTQRSKPAPPKPVSIASDLPPTPTVGPLFWVAAADGATRRDLPEWREYTGQAPFTAGDRWLEPALHPDDAPLVAQRWATATHCKQPFQLSHRLLGADGAYRRFLTQARPLLSADGQLLGWQGVSVTLYAAESQPNHALNHTPDHAVTETVSAADRYADDLVVSGTAPFGPVIEQGASAPDDLAAATVLQTILDMLPAGVAIYDADGRLTQMNAAGARLTRQSVVPDEQPLSRHRRYAMRRVDGSPMPEADSPSGRARRGETFADFECVIQGGSGPDTSLVTSGAPLRAADGQITGAVVIFQDVTALRAAELAARAQRELTETIIETTPFGVAVFDATDEFRCVRHNAPFLRLVGEQFQRAGSLVGVRLVDFLDDESGARVHEIFMATRDSGETFAIDEFPAVLLPEPEPRWYKWSLTPLRDAQGTVEALIVSAVEITELVRAREAVRQEAARSQAVLDTLPTAVVVFDADGYIVRTNPAAHALYEQVAISDYTERTFAERSRMLALRDGEGHVLPPALWPANRILYGETLHTGTTTDLQYETKQGDVRQLSLAGVPVRDETGRITGAVVVYQDITERRRLEEQATEHARQLEAIFEAMADGVVVYAPDGRILQANPFARSIMALGTPENYRDLPIEMRAARRRFTDSAGRLLPIEERPQWRILHGETIPSGQSQDIIIHTPATASQPAQQYTMSVSGAPIYDAEGNMAGAVAIWRDVGSKRALERRVHGALDALLQMADALVNGLGSERLENAGQAPRPTEATQVAHRLAELTNQVLGCQRVGITIIEPETERILPLAVAGLPPEQEQQWWAEQLAQDVHLADVTKTEPELMNRLQRGEVLLYDLTQPPYDAMPNPYGITVMLIASMRIGDEVIGWLTLDHGGVRHDYTPEELRLTGAVGQLIALVVERERLIGQREAARANALALEAANERMDTFLGIAGHELRTPLTSIHANLQITDRTLSRTLASLPDANPKLVRVADLLHKTSKQITRLERLVNELVDGARIHAGVMSLDEAPGDLAEIVRESVEEFQLTWPKRTITLTMEPTSIPIVTDAGRVNQVIANYLTNALKYSEEARPVRVVVSVEPATPAAGAAPPVGGQRQARVAVTDEGPGLSAEEQQRIWERFYRSPAVEVVDSTLMGVGLGLYISSTIIHRLGGQVGVVSAPGQGSTFWFTLPLK